MPVQQISVKNTAGPPDIERCPPGPPEPVYGATGGIQQDPGGRLGSTSSNISYSSADMCRICHCEADAANPLLSPCYCSGSLKYVHQQCLQQWLTASETRSCELCKFNFILHTKIKPINEWRRLEMSSVERRRLFCAILFHFVAAMCVVWSLFVLIDRAAEEVQRGLIAWPFWTKLVVVAVGFTGGAVFMYIQCRQYLHLCARWKAHNRIILVQNAPEKIAPPASPTLAVQIKPGRVEESSGRRSEQVVANIESSPHEPPPPPLAISLTSTGETSSVPTVSTTSNHLLRNNATVVDPLELNIQEMLALDLENTNRRMANRDSASVVSLGTVVDAGERPPVGTTTGRASRGVFKSLPNLSSSSENLLP